MDLEERERDPCATDSLDDVMKNSEEENSSSASDVTKQSEERSLCPSCGSGEGIAKNIVTVVIEPVEYDNTDRNDVKRPEESRLGHKKTDEVITNDTSSVVTKQPENNSFNMYGNKDGDMDITECVISEESNNSDLDKVRRVLPEEQDLIADKNNHATITHQFIREEIIHSGKNCVGTTQSEDSFIEGPNYNIITSTFIREESKNGYSNSVVTKQPGDDSSVPEYEDSDVPNCCDSDSCRCHCRCTDIACFQTAQACAECMFLVLCLQICMNCLKLCF